mgnify:CR=1 FL=1
MTTPNPDEVQKFKILFMTVWAKNGMKYQCITVQKEAEIRVVSEESKVTQFTSFKQKVFLDGREYLLTEIKHNYTVKTISIMVFDEAHPEEVIELHTNQPSPNNHQKNQEDLEWFAMCHCN